MTVSTKFARSRIVSRVGLFALGVSLLFSACAKETSFVPKSDSLPNIIFISLDTFRQDALGARSSGEDVTPNLNVFRRDSVNFSKAFVHYPHTLVSHASMFTGLYPDAHQVKDKKHRIPTTVSTLAELLQAAGYESAAVVTTDWLKPDFGFARGFRHYDFLRGNHTHVFADRVNAKALELADEVLENDSRLFLFLHYYDAHSDFGQTLPYYSPEDFRSGSAKDVDASSFCDEDGKCATQYLLSMDRRKAEVEPKQLDLLLSLYHSGIKYLDRQLGLFFEELRDRGLYEDSMIILTADHGEEFREHGEFIHTQTYDETITVPLLIKFPGNRYAGLTVAGLVETVDLLPTILSYLAIAVPSNAQGASLLPAIENGVASKDSVFSQHKLNQYTYSLRTARYKLIFNYKSKRARLYDLEVDPEEQTDISSRDEDTVRALQNILSASIAANKRLAKEIGPAEAEGLLSNEEIERLKALGYLE